MIFRNKWTLFGLPLDIEEQGKIAVFGIAYDNNSELKKGSIIFPNSIRRASYSIEWEEIHNNSFISVHNAEAVDFMDLMPSINSLDMIEEVFEFLDEIWYNGYRSFLVFGGNHSITYPIVKFLKEKNAIKNYLQLDAHLDFRHELKKDKYAFACVTRRIYEEGLNVEMYGVRSFSEEEFDAFNKIKIYNIDQANKLTLDSLVRNADYISIDMDVFTNANVTNPEPYGIDLKSVLDALKGYKGKFLDIVEGVPEKILGDRTSTMAALIARRFLIMQSL